MQKITFENLPSTNTPISAQNLNLLQDNVEDGIDEAGVVVSSTEPVTDRKKVWLQHSDNDIFDKDNANVINGYLNTGSGIISAYANNQLIYIPVEANKTYGIFKTVGVDPLWLATSTTTPAINGSFNNYQNAHSLRASITIPSGQQYLIVQIRLDGDVSAGLTTQQILNGLRIYEDYVKDKQYILNDNDVYEEFVNIESGSNTNGSYTKFPDGTLICYGTTMVDGWTTTTYPFAFISTPVVTTGGNSGTTETTTIMIIKTANIGTTTFRACRIVGSSYDNGRVDYIAIGRWK